VTPCLRCPMPLRWTGRPVPGGGFAVGDAVFLRGCPHGRPGRVLRIERGKLAVLWSDLGSKGKGNIVRVHADACEVLWRNGLVKRELVPQAELAWVGLSVRTFDGRSARVVELGRTGKIRVRLAEGHCCCWLTAAEMAPRAQAEQTETEVLAEQH
jgi:hypothetical protein